MKTTSLQDFYLNSIRKEKLTATFFLVNGYQLKGQLKAFDSFSLMIDSDGKQQMVYKHAISTIMPVRPVDLSPLEVETVRETE